MSWLYVPAMAASSLGFTLQPVAPPPQFVTSRGMPMRPKDWSNAWPRDSLLRLLSGPTCEPSTLRRGLGSWIASLRVSRASHLVRLGIGKALQTADGCGQTSQERLPLVHPVLSSLKTCQGCDNKGCETCFPTLPASGSMRSGIVSQLPPLARPTVDTESGFWATPTASDYKRGLEPSQLKRRSQSLTVQAAHWGLRHLGARRGRTPCLNLQFGEHLMGLPIGWTAFTCSETAWCHWQQRMFSGLLRAEQCERDDK